MIIFLICLQTINVTLITKFGNYQYQQHFKLIINANEFQAKSNPVNKTFI